MFYPDSLRVRGLGQGHIHICSNYSLKVILIEIGYFIFAMYKGITGIILVCLFLKQIFFILFCTYSIQHKVRVIDCIKLHFKETVIL